MRRLMIPVTLLALLGCADQPGKSPAAPAGKNPVVVMETSMGPIKIELFEDKAPGTVKNFLSYVDDKFYDNLIFHRVIGGFMIQGGGFGTDFKEIVRPQDMTLKQKKTKSPIRNESNNGVSNARGTIAMARTGDPDSATSQFFINVVDNADKLDRNLPGNAGYCVFGRVVEGMDVVDKIKAVKTKTLIPGLDDVPEEDVIIKSVRRVKDEQ